MCRDVPQGAKLGDRQWIIQITEYHSVCCQGTITRETVGAGPGYTTCTGTTTVKMT